MASPKKQPRSAQWRADDLVNTFTKMGDATRDKRLQTSFQADKISQKQLEEWYRGSDLAATIVELVPEEMFRKGFDLFLGDDDERQDTVKDTMSLLDERGFLDKLQEGFDYARAYGGAGILLGADDARELNEPLEDEASIKSFEWMNVLSPAELRPVEWDEDVKSPRFGEVVFYELTPQSRNNGQAMERTRVHHTRLIRIDGVRTSRLQKRAQDANGWGDSVLVRCYSVVRDYTAGWQGAALLLQHFAQAFLKLKGLAEMVAEEEGTKALYNRALGIQVSRSVSNMVIIDEEEELGVLSTPLGGYPEMMQQFAIRLSSACRIPVTLLMGQSPAGLNATGDNDVRNFYARVASMQNKQLRPALNRVLQLLFRSADGPTAGKEPETWEVRFKPLWQLTELQLAEVMQKVASADNVYLMNQVVTPEELAISRFGTGEFSMTTTIDKEARENPPEPIEEEPPEPEPGAEEPADETQQQPPVRRAAVA